MEISVENAFARHAGEQVVLDDILVERAAHELAHNGLLVTIDYLEFTMFADSAPDADDINGREIEVIEEVLMIDSDQFMSLPTGLDGYPKRLKWMPTSLFVLYGAGPRHGVHVTLSGNACRAYASQVGDLMSLMVRIVTLGGKVSRLDMAVDDLVTQYYSISELLDCYRNGEIISRWRYLEQQFRSQIEGRINVKECLYFGSMKSDCFLRVYNKTLEQMVRAQRPIDEFSEIESVWTRWELVLRRKTAMGAVNLLLAPMNLGDVWCGIMANYFRLVQAEADTNRSRWQTQEKWVHFVGQAAPLSIKMYPEERSLSTIKAWIAKQAAPTLATILKADENLVWIVDTIFAAANRINPYNRAMIEAELARKAERDKRD